MSVHEFAGELLRCRSKFSRPSNSAWREERADLLSAKIVSGVKCSHHETAARPNFIKEHSKLAHLMNESNDQGDL